MQNECLQDTQRLEAFGLNVGQNVSERNRPARGTRDPAVSRLLRILTPTHYTWETYSLHRPAVVHWYAFSPLAPGVADSHLSSETEKRGFEIVMSRPGRCR